MQHRNAGIRRFRAAASLKLASKQPEQIAYRGIRRFRAAASLKHLDFPLDELPPPPPPRIRRFRAAASLKQDNDLITSQLRTSIRRFRAAASLKRR